MKIYKNLLSSIINAQHSKIYQNKGSEEIKV